VIENNHLFEDCAYKVLGFSAPDLTNLGRAWHEPAAGTITLLNARRLHSMVTRWSRQLSIMEASKIIRAIGNAVIV
jgi:hypothetical protein